MKLFSVEEANALLPALSSILEKLRDAQQVLAEGHRLLAGRAPANGGGTEAREVFDAMASTGGSIGELQQAGVVVRDPASGLIDFPSERDGQTVFLCWRLGEPRVEWWHPTTSGFADRRPL